MSYSLRSHACWALVSLSLLAGCGGGGEAGTPVFRDVPSTGGGGGTGSGGGSSASPDPAGPSASFAQQCAANNTLAAANLRNSTLDTEKKWVRAYFDEAYLWRDEVPRVDPTAYSSSNPYDALDSYFEALKSPQRTDSGALRDRFSFTYETAKWKAMSENATEAGYGIEWSSASTTPPRRLRIAYVEPGTPAANASLQRGDELVSVDGTDADTPTAAGVAVLNEGLYPSTTGTSHAFVFRRNGVTLSRSLASATITRNPVPQARVLTLANGARAGYLLFNDHNLPAEQLLINAVSDFRTQGVTELVLDLRYNGGGYLFIASELATMIAGTTRTTGQAFETLRYNARRSAENETTPFFAESCIAVNGRCSSVQPLPTLNLRRVYVLAQKGTCSASESIINGLRGVNVDVVLIGGQTCGKPYGFTAKDNCGISYFPIEFAGVNAKGFGDYADGFVPGTGASARFVPGCTVADDFGRALGDTQEGMLAAAMQHAATGQCPIGMSTGASVRALSGLEGGTPLQLQRHPARSNRLLLPR
ncbi:S41 family peptidase [Roseateles sp. DC23W]|uniref:S41 family peptidase n=1 Tax=Pelomonas dachongensis TaxID=3299029 RepID=A0ABW7ELQ9_9BURK